MFPQARNIIKHSSGLSCFKLLIATAAYSRPWLASLSLRMLQWFASSGKFAVSYRANQTHRKVLLRMEHLQSDLCSALELAVNDCYSLKQLRQPEFVVDGGGNTGLFTLAVRARWPRTHIVVCEPLEENLKILKENLALNGVCVDVLPVALGRTPGKRHFYCREANQGSLSASLPYWSQREVEVLTLSEICKGHEGQDKLIKLDIEGAEVEVLEEFLTTERTRTTIVGELHHQQSEKPKLCKLLTRAGWEVRFIKEDTQCSQFHLFSADQRPVGITNC